MSTTLLINDSMLSILSSLSDGEWHSGEGLGESLGVTRAAVAKYIKRLPELGLECESEKGRGYRLRAQLDLLRKEALGEGLQALGLDTFHFFPLISSSNHFLMGRIREGLSVQRHLCVAEMQSQGRGRRGRVWHSPYGTNLCLSLGWQFDGGVSVLEGLSLAIGVVVCDELAAFGVEGLSLKWPNDILLKGKKLGGILIELAGDASGDCAVVIGLGLNINMRNEKGVEIDQPWTSLLEEGLSCDRNQLVINIVQRMMSLLERYPSEGFTKYLARWNALNAYRGKKVAMISGENITEGLMLGVSESGAALLEINGEVQSIVGGELSLRLCE